MPKKAEAGGGEERFSRPTELGTAVADPKTETASKNSTASQKGRLASAKSELELLGREIRKQLAETEKKLKDAQLPAEILERHYAFVEHYESNLAQLKGNLERLDQAGTEGDIDAEIEKIRQQLAPTQEPARPRKLDPNALIQREPKVIPREPRLKKEEFERDTEGDKHAWRNAKRIQVASIGSLAGLLVGSVTAGTLPTDADLAENADVKLTPEIRGKAQELDNNPVRIYEWVRNNVEFVPTWGAIQGAQATLLTKQGNAFDTASLLIALLRAAGIHARYVMGTIELPVDKAMNWAGGFSDPLAAATLLSSSGIPVKLINSAGAIQKLQLEHVWVEAWIDYAPSRGARHQAGLGDTWIPLDASYKQQQGDAGIDFTAAAPFDSAAFVSQLTGAATVSESGGYATNVRCAAVSQQQEAFRSQVEDFLAAEHPDATVDAALGTRDPVAQEYPYLLGTLPYRTVVKGALYSELPSSLRHSVTFVVVNNDRNSANYSETSLLRNLALTEVAGKRVTLSYTPATAADEAAILAYAPRAHADGTPIRLDEYPSSLPAYLVQVKAELRVDGTVVASGTVPSGLGGYDQVSIRINHPNRGGGSQDLVIKAGEYLGIAFGSGSVPGENLARATAALEETAARLNDDTSAGLIKDDVIGGFLHASALTHLAEIDALSAVRARVMGVESVRLPSSSVVTLMIATNYFFGIPRGISVAGPSTPEMGYHSVVAAKDGNRDKAKRFLMLSGLDASVLASNLQEYLLSTPQYPVTAVSAVKAMAAASERGIPLYRLTPSGSATIAGKLQLYEEVEQSIINDASAGLTLIAPQRNLAMGAWTGVGYQALDTASGNNYTNLNGPPNVVQGLPWFARSILLSVSPAGATPPTALSSSVLSGSYTAALRSAASGLEGLSGRRASDSLNLLTSSLMYERVGDQLGCYLDLASPPVSSGACMTAYLSLLCTAAGTSVIFDTNVKPVADAGADRMAGVGETVVLDGSRSFDANNDPLTYQWRLSSVPAGSDASLVDASSVAPSFFADVAGTYIAELIVRDGKAASAPDTVTIAAAPATVEVPSLSGLTIAKATSVLQTKALTAGAISVGTDSAVEAGRIKGQSPAAGSGADRGSAVSLVVSTGPEADTTPPVISTSLDRSPALYAAGTSVQLTVGASDIVGVSSITTAVDGAAATPALPVTTIDTTGFAPGSTHTVVVAAEDYSSNSASATVSFGILDPEDKTPPVISDISPATDSAITAPVEIRGTVTDNNLFQYTLAYAPAGKSSYTLFATGNRSVTNGALGRLDPSLMQNGIYDILLTAVDAYGNTTTYTTRYRVTGDLKVGNFTVSFIDLSIPVSGIPVTVTRSYDSRDKGSHDFGVGWTIDIQSIKIEENAPPGEGWVQSSSSSGGFPTFCVGSEGERYIAITLPDGRVEEFDQTVTPQCRPFVPIDYPTISYTPRPGTTSTLRAKNVGLIRYDRNSGVLLDTDSLQAYNPSEYLLTAADGAMYELDQGFGVRKVSDSNGNTLTYSATGVTHSSGKSLVFSRDAKGRITRITSPGGGVIGYNYDANGDLESVTDPAGNVTRYTYNKTHGLLDVIDPLGRRAVRNEYDGAGRLTAHIDAEGKRIEYNHDIAGRQEVVKDRNGNVTVFIYDDNGRVLKKTDPLGKSVSYSYDSVGNKLSETDPLGNTTIWTYDGKRNVLSETKVIDGQSITTRHTYNTLGKVLTTTDPKGNVTANSYDGKGNLLTTTDPLGKVTTNTYDSNGNLLTTTDPLGNVTRYEYDSYGNQTKQTGPSGAVTSYSYDSRGNKITETDPRGNTTSYGYDNNGKLLKVTDALGNVTTYEYNKAGNKVAETNPVLLVTRYTYDSASRLVATTYPDGTTTSTTFDAEGNRATSTDRLGRVTSFSYNANKQLVKTTFPDGTSQSLGYDAAGRQVSSTDAAGKTSTKEYDALGRMIRSTDPENHSIAFEYDANGNQVRQTDPNGYVTRYEYDGANRQVRTILPGGQSSTVDYDALGRKIAETDAAGITTRFAFDETGNLATVTDALAQVTRYEYDQNNNRTAIVDANGHRTEFAFDQLSRMIAKTMPNGGVERYAYDAAGRQASKTDAKGQKVGFSYDAANRLVARTYPDGSSVEFTYTATGKRATAKDKRGTTTYTYNDRYRLTGTTNPDGKSIGYSYDQTGRLATLTGPAGTIRYAYSDGGRLTSVTDPEGRVTTYSYDNSGNRTGLSYPNGTGATYSYDVNNRLTQLTHNSADSVIASYAYTLGAIGNRTRIDEGTGISRVYTYDSLYRLTREQVTDPAGAQTYTDDYTYDSVGNRLNKTHTPGAEQPVVSTDYSYNAADQLVTENGVTYSYDLNGNLASRTDNSGTTTYHYNFDDRMVRVTTPTQTLTFAYDVDGNRIETAGPEGTTRYLVDANRGLSQILAEYKLGGTLVASYVYADDLISMTRNNETHWYHFDGQGSTRLLIDNSGTVTDSNDYDSFGNLIARVGMTENTFFFTGQQYDANTGLYHLRSRYYQPGAGRFIAVDPWEGDAFAPVTLHRYLYTGNDPVNKMDPTGLYSIGEFAAASAISAVLGGASAVAVNYARGSAQTASSIAMGAVAGAAIAPLVLVSPAVAAVAATVGVVSSGYLAIEVFMSQGASVWQKATAGGMLLASIAGGPAATKYIKSLEFRAGTSIAQNKILGDKAVTSFVRFMEQNGVEVVATEVYVKSPFYQVGRRFDAIIRNPHSRELWGIEIKSTEGAFRRSNTPQEAADSYINQYGGIAFGEQAAANQIAGQEVVGTYKILWTD